MNEHHDDPVDPAPADDDADPVLSEAGARLRQDSSAISPAAVEVAVLRRRSRRRGVLAAAAVAVVAVLGGALVAGVGSDDGTTEVASEAPGAPTVDEVDALVSSLDDQPIDPTEVQLLSTVSTFADCGALIGDLRRVGAEHVGSRGFGGYGGGPFPTSVEEDMAYSRNAATFDATTSAQSFDEGTTLGTNVQVAGVDELDFVKAEGSLVYDLDPKGNLRITDVRTMQVVGTVDVTPAEPEGQDEHGGGIHVQELLVAEGRVAVFGTEVVVSDPVEGDPSATRASTSYMTVTFVDATDPAAPTVTDRVRIEGSLVSARLVEGEIRLVTTSHMADLGFLMPTTPTSVPKALDANRRSVAGSTAPDWIPDYQHDGGEPEPLVPCDRVHVPDTFAGVAMTSMVTFPIGTGGFEPAGTSILAPATTLYAGLDKVAISSEVWVDPIDRERLEFDDWQTAIHEFGFEGDTAPTYVGSGIVDGSTVGQFAFGEVGGSIAVVTTEGTPWDQDGDTAVDMTILTPDGDGGLSETSKIEDLAGGKGAVTAVRFVEGRVLISTGFFGREVHVIDVTDPAAPRRAGRVTVPGDVGYFHPLPDGRALVIGTRYDHVGSGEDRVSRSWVQAHLLDVSNADAPAIVGTWERPWVSDQVGADHHAFTYWPDRALAMWGLMRSEPGTFGQLNEAIVLGTDGGPTEVAIPQANKPNEVPAPCPVVEITDPEIEDMIGRGSRVLRCEDPDVREVEWPRYQCSKVDDAMIRRFVPEDQRNASYQLCYPAPSPTVSRILVVAGRPILLTDQTMEVLDPETFQSLSVTYHPTRSGMAYGG